MNPLSALRRLRRSQDGAAMTEKLVVVVIGIMLIVPAVGVLGPMLQAKFAVATSALGGSAVETLADRKVPATGSTISVYVFFFMFFFTAFFAVFVAPLLFPRARITRQSVIKVLADKFPFLEPISDWHTKGMEELYRLNAELEAMRPKDGALQVKSRDLGDTSDPNEVTAARKALSAPLATSYLLDDDPPLSELPPMGDHVLVTPDDSATSNWVDPPPRSQHPSAPQHVPNSHQVPSSLSLSQPADDPDMSLMTSIPIAQIDPHGQRNQGQRSAPPTNSQHPVYQTGRKPAVRPLSGHFPVEPAYDDADATVARNALSTHDLPEMPRFVEDDDDDETTINIDGPFMRGTIQDGTHANDADASTKPSRRGFPDDFK